MHDHSDRSTSAGSGRNTQQVWGDQRVFENTLVSSARGCQGSTNDQPRDDAGQADIYDDIFHAIGPSRLQRQDLRAEDTHRLIKGDSEAAYGKRDAYYYQ